MSGCAFRPLFRVDSLSLWESADFNAGSGVVDPGAEDGCVGVNSFPDWCVDLAGIGLQPKFLTMDGHPKSDSSACFRRHACRHRRSFHIVSASTDASALFEGLGAAVNFGRKVIRFEKLQDETPDFTYAQWTLQHESDDFPRSVWYLPSTEIRGYLLRRTPQQADVHLYRKELESRVLASIPSVKKEISLTQAPSSNAKRGRDLHHANCDRQTVRCTDSIGQCRQRRKMM